MGATAGKLRMNAPRALASSSPTDRHNNFDFLRQFAAFLVIVGHSQSLIGAPHSAFWGVSVSTFGVQIFFAVSGYLVTESWLRTPSMAFFLRKRGFRIFPGLVVCTLLTAFVMGPAMTRLPVDEYFSHPGTFQFLKNALLYPVYFLPGLFEANIYPNAVNGSLWSLPVEFACYIGVLAAGAILRRPLPAVAILVGTIIVLSSHVGLNGREPVVIWGSPLRESLEVMPFFVGGAFFRLILKPGLFQPSLVVLAVAAIIAADILMPGKFWTVTWLAVPYIVLSFGLSELPLLRRSGRFGDPSYGMYLYAFPIQQCLQQITENGMTLWSMIVLTTVLSAALGYASWHLIEKPVLVRMKGSLGTKFNRRIGE